VYWGVGGPEGVAYPGGVASDGTTDSTADFTIVGLPAALVVVTRRVLVVVTLTGTIVVLSSDVTTG
jgi:hypothetical protein